MRGTLGRTFWAFTTLISCGKRGRSQIHQFSTPCSTRCHVFRSGDFKLVLLVAYSIIFITCQPLSPNSTLLLHFSHAVFWRLFHSFGLGLLLKAQSDSKWMVRHYVKHYHYPPGTTGAVEEAFNNWKGLYNLSLCMTYGKYPASSTVPNNVI